MARKQAGRGTRSRGGARKQGRASRPRSGAKAAKTKRAGTKAVRKRAARTPAGARKRSPAKPAQRAKKAAAKPARKPTPSSSRAVTRKKAAPNTPAPRRQAPSLERSRRRLTEVDDNIPTPPSSLDLDRTPTAARSGRQASKAARSQHTETGPELTGGDVDANWEDAYSVGDEAPGGDNPTPDQDRVDDIGRSLGVEYQDNEELKGGDKIAGRDKHRWELDPASAEDYNDREE